VLEVYAVVPGLPGFCRYLSHDSAASLWMPAPGIASVGRREPVTTEGRDLLMSVHTASPPAPHSQSWMEGRSSVVSEDSGISVTSRLKTMHSWGYGCG
jgi:hypothetical protein